jgi:hypothetical protein
MKKLLLVLALFSFTTTFAQDFDGFIQLLKSDIKTEKIAIITEVMAFTEKESEAFWPVYREFEYELSKLSDKRILNIKDFAVNYDSLSEKKAEELIENSFSFQEDRLSLNKEYYKKFAEVITPTVAAKYMQLEHQIQLLLDLTVSSSLPLAKKPGSVK